MNKKKNLLALALSVSFVLGANSISYAEEDINQIPQAKEETQNLDKAVNELVVEEKVQEEVPATDKAVENIEEEKTTPVDASNKENEPLQVSDAVNPENVGATESTEPNYADDEKEIKDFNESERYRSTQMEQGNGPTDLSTESNMDSKDGFSYKNLEPSATSEDKTKWGIEIEIDKEKGQRTYTDFSFTNSGKMAEVLDPGSVSSKEEGEKLAEGFKDPNYKAKSEIDITASRQQRNLNLYASEEDIKHINNVDNKNTTMAWEGHYTKDNPNGLKATEGSNVAFTFTVNPWPNENDRLSLIKLNGTHDQKEFVQGQTITTKVKVENLDENARLRLVGQVYHPITGEVVEGAKAYINDEGMVVVEMPKGAVDENGNINKDSIFYKDPKYKGIQNLEVKFFARPRTAGEFRAIVDSNMGGFYTQTGAGTRIINHKGEDIEVDLQGIDRYDHYNLIGGFKINLDDTRYYDQGFIDGNKDDTSKHTSSAVKPGEEFEVNLYVPEDKKDKDLFPNQKTPEEMEAAKENAQAVGSIDWQFIDKINEGKNEEDKWKLEYDESTLPTTFKITPPKSAKAGEFVAVPLTYTYTNGSTDVHWFHFVVQESTNNKPEYEVKVDFPSEEQKSTPELPENPDNKKLEPKRYTIPEGTEFKDDKGNEWNVSIDETTGEVTAIPKDPSKFDGGETLRVPVVAHYEDPLKPDEAITEETKAEFVIKEKSLVPPDYDAKNGKAGDELTSSPKTEGDGYNRKPSRYTLEDGKLEGTYTDNEGNEWNVTINEDTGEVTATVPKAADGDTIKLDGTIINVPVTAHYKDSKGNEIGSKKANVQFLGSGTEGTHTYTNKKPFEVEVRENPELKKGEHRVVQKGIEGEEEYTITIKDSKVVKTSDAKETKKPVNEIIEVGSKDFTGTHEYTNKIPYDVEVRVNPELKKGERKIVQKGEVGEETYTITIENSKVTKTSDPVVTKEAKKEIIEVGNEDYTGNIDFTDKEPIPVETIIEFDDSLKPGETKVVQEGELGERSKTRTLTLKNGAVTEIKEGEFTETKKAKDKIIKVGRNTEGKVEHKEEIPFGYKVEEVDDLKKGEYRIVKPGKVGTKTTTWIIKNSEVDGDPTEVIVEAEDALIQVGKGTNDGTHEIVEKKELPFETKYEYDDSLEPGEEKVVQEGNPGEKERTNTLVIKDGKVVETKEGEYKTIKEPTDRIIKIGRKPSEGETTKTIEREIHFDTQVIYDENLESGSQVIEKEGKLGKEEVTITQKVKDSKPVGDPTETTKTIIEKEDRVVRIGIKPVERITELGHDTEYRHNPELKEGEEKVIEKGSKGYVKYITTFNKETGKLEVREERVEPTNKVVEYGSKTDGEFTYESEQAYDIIIRENPDLEAGKTNIIQEGIVGKTETTVKIENSKEVDRTTKTITEKQDKIIEVGTKNVCEIPPVDPEDPKNPENPDGENPKDPEKPGEEDPSDPENPDGEDPKDPEKPGEEDPKDPENPDGEDPKDPEKPGEEDPSDPENPDGEDPKDPEKPGEEDPSDPEKPGEEDPKDPEKPDGENPKPEDTPEEPKANTEDKKIKIPQQKLNSIPLISEAHAIKEKSNPKTGIDGVGSVISGLVTSVGAMLLTKKKKGDQ